MIKTINLTANEETQIDVVGGTHIKIKNLSDSTVYVSKHSDIVAGADNVKSIQGGTTDILVDVATCSSKESTLDYYGTIYALGESNCKIELETTNNANFKQVSGGGGSSSVIEEVGEYYFVGGIKKGEIFNDYEHNVANGEYSHAEGYMTTANGKYSHTQGFSTTAEGDNSHAEGSGTKATGDFSHAEGGGTKATGDFSHAEGGGTKATGKSSHAEGGGTNATGNYSHAEGGSTNAIGDNSHAEGHMTTASGKNSHAGGSYTIASGENQVAIGMYNIANTKYALIIGNGTSEERSNALAVDWQGNIIIKNDKNLTDIINALAARLAKLDGDKSIVI